jgi:hypothetical protein
MGVLVGVGVRVALGIVVGIRVGVFVGLGVVEGMAVAGAAAAGLGVDLFSRPHPERVAPVTQTIIKNNRNRVIGLV